MFGFGKALDVLRAGDAVQREEWVDVVLMLSNETIEPMPSSGWGRLAVRRFDEAVEVTFPQMLVTVSRDAVVSPWPATSADLLAEDWDYAR